MKYLVVKIRPKSSFHLGEREQWYEGSKVHLPADTLFSALCHCYLLLNGEVESFVRQFRSDEVPFLISSGFPFWYEDYYFPLPKNKFLSPDEMKSLKEIFEKRKDEKGQSIELKEIKKIQFVNLRSLLLLLSGQSLFDLVLNALEDGNLRTIPVLFRCRESEEKEPDNPWREKPWSIDRVPRISLSRLSSHPGEKLFHFGQVYYHPKAGLFVMVKINQPQWETKIRSLFFLLSHEGIGGDRTCGHGLFDGPEFTEIEVPDIDGDGLYCLSPYFPAENEGSGLAEGFYDLEERKGYIFSPAGSSLRRRSVRLFSEGSVFPRNLNRRGFLVDLTPDIFRVHRVFRYGFLFSLSCYLEEK
ncbi:MAG: type III-A CRISPR-associated RAMP protein Csm4 [Clostridiales bacterium]|nr:type III-A CRISPR-associated RAMP protein Csm4 [Clostridiales bacterium]